MEKLFVYVFSVFLLSAVFAKALSARTITKNLLATQDLYELKIIESTDLNEFDGNSEQIKSNESIFEQIHFVFAGLNPQLPSTHPAASIPWEHFETPEKPPQIAFILKK
ncbi:MAG: hypothetical protein EOO90_13790 [Pedobacter sp.]|nr:MAG: hypothetical protein EOO90_13790 [Pedobacter sp.]